MGKTHRKDPMQNLYDMEEQTMELYDKLASQYAQRVESKLKARA
jgi:hypothetical protein